MTAAVDNVTALRDALARLRDRALTAARSPGSGGDPEVRRKNFCLEIAEELDAALAMAGQAAPDKAPQCHGWAVFAPSGAVSWRSFETSRDASIGAFLGWSQSAADNAQRWASHEAAGYRCMLVSITAGPPPPAPSNDALKSALVRLAKIIGRAWDAEDTGDGHRARNEIADATAPVFKSVGMVADEGYYEFPDDGGAGQDIDDALCVSSQAPDEDLSVLDALRIALAGWRIRDLVDKEEHDLYVKCAAASKRAIQSTAGQAADAVVNAARTVVNEAWTDRWSRLHGHWSIAALDAALKSAAGQATPSYLEYLADRVINAARKMPRQTPAGGAAGTVHSYLIAAADTWELDRALRDYDAERSRQTAGQAAPAAAGEDEFKALRTAIVGVIDFTTALAMSVPLPPEIRDDLLASVEQLRAAWKPFWKCVPLSPGGVSDAGDKP